MPPDFGERLASLRRGHDLSQEELADRLGLSRQAISNWERSQSAPDTANLVALAGLYGLSLDELMDLDAPARGGIAAESDMPASPSWRSAAVAIAATAVLSCVYYILLAQPLMNSTVDDVTEMLGLGVSPALALVLFVLEAVAVAVPFVVLALVLRLARRRFPFIWLVPLVTFFALAGSPAASSLLFGLPVREFTGIGGYESSSVTVKADVLGLALGCACVALAQRGASVQSRHRAVSRSLH
jgi:transcriptional regulator with XRE-family HTH domain